MLGEIIENDPEYLTVKVDGKVYVYNKVEGYWYSSTDDKIIRMDPAIEKKIFQIIDEIEAFPLDFFDFFHFFD